MSSEIPRWLFIVVIVVVVAIIGAVGYWVFAPAPVRLKTADELAKMKHTPPPPPPRIPGK